MKTVMKIKKSGGKNIRMVENRFGYCNYRVTMDGETMQDFHNMNLADEYFNRVVDFCRQKGD